MLTVSSVSRPTALPPAPVGGKVDLSGAGSKVGNIIDKIGDTYEKAAGIDSSEGAAQSGNWFDSSISSFGSNGIQSANNLINTGSKAARVYNVGRTAYDGGMATAGPIGQIGTSLKQLKIFDGAIWQAGQAVAKTGFEMGQRSALFAGGISGVVNGYRLVTGRISLPTFGERVVGDTIGAFGGGIGASIAGGIGATAMGALGITGGFATAGLIAAGMVGYTMAERATRNTKIVQDVTRAVKDTLSGSGGGYSAAQ
jgi:hypothetical protein